MFLGLGIMGFVIVLLIAVSELYKDGWNAEHESRCTWHETMDNDAAQGLKKEGKEVKE